MEMVKYKILFLFIVNVIVSPLHGADWASRRHLYTQGLFDSLPVEHQAYSPVMGMNLLEGELGKKIYNEERKTPRGILARTLLHRLDEKLRKTALRGNLFYSIKPKEFGVLVKMLREAESVDGGIDNFMQTPYGQQWHKDHKERGGTGSMGVKKFTNLVKKNLKPLNDMTPEDRAHVFSMFGAALSENQKDLSDYVSGLTGQDIKDIHEPYDLSVLPPPEEISSDQLVSKLIDNNLSAYQKLVAREQLRAPYKGQISVPICAEQALWGFINIVLYDSTTKELTLSLLPDDVKVNPALIAFIEQYKSFRRPDYYDEATNAFMEMVSEIPEVTYRNNPGYELIESIENAVKVINHLFNLREKTIGDCGKKLSTAARIVALDEKDESLVKIRVSDPERNYVVSAEWNFSMVHASLELVVPGREALIPYIKSIVHYEKTYPDMPLGQLATDLFGAALKKDNAALQQFGFASRADLLSQILELPSVDFNNINIERLSLLRFLIREEDFESAKLLLEQGADIKSINSFYYVSHQIKNVVLFLLENGANAEEILDAAINKTPESKDEEESYEKIVHAASEKLTLKQRTEKLDYAYRKGARVLLSILFQDGVDIEKAWKEAIQDSSYSVNFLRELSRRGGGLDDLEDKIELLNQKGVKLPELLRDAVSAHNRKEIDYLVGSKQVHPSHGLVGAVHSSDEEMIEFMLEKGAELGHGLAQAMKDKNDPMIALMLSKGAKGDVKVLSHFVISNNDELVKKLLDDGVKPTSAMVNQAIKNNNPKMALLLLGHGAEITSGMIDAAIEKNDEGLAEVLYEKGARASFSALRRAAGGNNLERAKLLLEKGAPVKDLSSFGNGILQGAIEHRNKDMARLLLENGAQEQDISLWMTELFIHNKAKHEQVKKFLKEVHEDMSQ